MQGRGRLGGGRLPLATRFITNAAAAAATTASPRLVGVAPRKSKCVEERETKRERKEKKRKVQLHEKQKTMFQEIAQLLPASVGTLKSTAGATYSSHYPLKGIKGVDDLKGPV